jgi:hypothetical protein
MALNAKSGKMPFFVAAPRCVISLAGQDIAYAVGLSMSVSKVLEPVRILGKFAPVTFESLMVNPVRGSLQIVRLLSSASQNADAATKEFGGAGLNSATFHNPEKAVTAADPTQDSAAAPGVIGTAGTILSQAGLYRHLDPVSLILSQSFDIQISLKVPTLSPNNFDDGLLAKGSYTLTSLPFITIKNARLSGARGSITPASLFRESFTFEGLLAIQNGESGDNSWKDMPGTTL